VWANPSEELCAVEPLESVPPPQKPGVDYLKLATHCVMDRFGDDVSEEEAEQLAASLVKQWKQSGGHASIYLDGNLVIHYTLQEHAGGSNITATEQPSELDALLEAMNAPPNEAPAIMARLNLGQTIEFRDARGWKIKVWHDPKQRCMIYERAGDSVPTSGNPSLLASCPKCTALLIPQGDGLLPPACPICGCATATAH
jgi:hypothetical protein